MAAAGLRRVALLATSRLGSRMRPSNITRDVMEMRSEKHHLIIYCDIDRTGDKDHHSSMKTASPIATNSGDADRLSDTAR